VLKRYFRQTAAKSCTFPRHSPHRVTVCHVKHRVAAPRPGSPWDRHARRSRPHRNALTEADARQPAAAHPTLLHVKHLRSTQAMSRQERSPSSRITHASSLQRCAATRRSPTTSVAAIHPIWMHYPNCRLKRSQLTSSHSFPERARQAILTHRSAFSTRSVLSGSHKHTPTSSLRDVQ
jgi:hypothetical protein